MEIRSSRPLREVAVLRHPTHGLGVATGTCSREPHHGAPTMKFSLALTLVAVGTAALTTPACAQATRVSSAIMPAHSDATPRATRAAASTAGATGPLRAEPLLASRTARREDPLHGTSARTCELTVLRSSFSFGFGGLLVASLVESVAVKRTPHGFAKGAAIGAVVGFMAGVISSDCHRGADANVRPTRCHSCRDSTDGSGGRAIKLVAEVDQQVIAAADT